jgi:DNA-binding IclR family transcriptional regulator
MEPWRTVLQALRAIGPQTITELAEQTQFMTLDVRALLAWLESRDLAKRPEHPDGEWCAVTH